MAFDPKPYMIKLKGKEYLQVAPRILWVRSDHPECSIETHCEYADETTGTYRFRAVVEFDLAGKDGAVRRVRGVGHGMATRKEFPSGPAEKSETKALGRALAFLGYGTMNAQELEDDDAVVVADSPVDRQQRAVLAVVREPVDLETLRAEVVTALAADPDAQAKLPKPPAEMNEAELSKTLAWLKRRVRAGTR